MHLLIASLALSLLGDNGAGGGPEKPDGADGRSGLTASERGRLLLTGQSFLSPEWKLDAYPGASCYWEGVAVPDPERDPEGYASAFASRYGLHPSPFPNDGLPMGIRRATEIDPDEGEEPRVGLQVDCMICHGGSIGGTSYVGLGNSQLDMIGFYRDVYAADGRPILFTGFTVNTVRGAVNAGQMAAVLLSLRRPDLSRRLLPLPHDADFPELDVPAWWLLKHKRTMYYDGRTDARSVRSIMQFLMGEYSRDQFEAAEHDFADVLAYIKSIEPPTYPFPIDRAEAERGRALFEEHCTRCHGTYGEDRTYPNRVVPLDVIGTDPARATAHSETLIDLYNASWFGEHFPALEDRGGYQAPPLDGIWATAPYLHNGSVPTLHALLDSSTRPDRFRRPPSTDFEHYDRDHIGWRTEPLGPDSGDDHDRSIYDTRRYGLGNQGHLFGDPLTEEERMAVIEYLKTL